MQPATVTAAAAMKRAMVNKETLLRELRPARIKKPSGTDADGDDSDHSHEEGIDGVLS